MYNVLIAEDEVLIARGIEQKIPWESLGCRVAGVCFNGGDAFSMLETHCPDLLITDIVMPDKTGLDLCRYIQEQGLRTKVLLLSAYDDFSYAQKAVKYGAEDYILKPIDIHELIKAIDVILDKLDATRTEQQERAELNQKMKTIKPYLTNSILFNLAIYNQKEDMKIDNLPDSLEKGLVSVIKIYKTGSGALSELQAFVYTNKIIEALQRITQCMHKELEDFMVVVLEARDRSMYDKLLDCLEELRRDMYEKHECVLEICVSNFFLGIHDLHNQYQKVLSLRNYFFFEKANRVVTHRDHRKTEENLDIDTGQLYNDLREGNEIKTLETFRSMAGKMKSSHNAELCLGIFKEIERHMQNIARNTGSDFPMKVNIQIDGSDFESICQSIEGEIIKICRFLHTTQGVAEKICAYVEQNYADCSLSLQKVSDYLGVNHSYASRLFKKKIGVNFSAYLTALRLQKACYLLSGTELKNAEIAEKTGFTDERYFGQVFKKKYGKTPKEFKSMPTPANFKKS